MKGTRKDPERAWCPGCGNFPVLKALDQALGRSKIDREKLVLVSGIGQAAKCPHYTDANVFNGLHGRALPAATGIKLANHELTVIVTSGDGDIYGEGGNHFLHSLRRNVGVKAFVHNNQVYALTKGQASPTSDLGFKTKIQNHGVIHQPLNPLALAIVEEVSFVARSTAAIPDHLEEVMVEAMQADGFALLDILQPCVTYNQVNTYQWCRNACRPLPESHDPYDREKALLTALAWGGEIPIGVIYRSRRKSFEALAPGLSRGTLVGSFNSSGTALPA